MASFDPSVISQIPTLAGNPMQSVQQAYQLKDLANQEQLDTLKLNQAKQGVSDAAKAKKILSGYDLSDPTQLMKASEALNKAGQADRAMDLLKESQSQTKAKYEISEAHIKILQATSDFIGPNAIAIKQTLAKNSAMARAQYADLMGQILPQLPPELAASIPAQPPKDDAQFGQLLDKAISGSAQARQALTLHLGERKQDTAEASLAEREKHDRAMEAKGAPATGPKANRDAGIRAAMADLGISFPPGMRSVKAQEQTLQGLMSAHPNDTDQQIAERVRAGELGFKGAGTALNVVERREASSAAAINALNRQGGLYDQVLETGKKVDFGSAKFANAWNLYRQGNVIADPDISEYINALADTRAEFASVLARGGQVTDSVRIAAEHAFPDKMSYQELARNVSRSKKIAESIQSGNTSVADAIINGKSLDKALQESKGSEGPKRISSDADYNALPSGATFIAPDGSTRKKP